MSNFNWHRMWTVEASNFVNVQKRLNNNKCDSLYYQSQPSIISIGLQEQINYSQVKGFYNLYKEYPIRDKDLPYICKTTYSVICYSTKTYIICNLKNWQLAHHWWPGTTGGNELFSHIWYNKCIVHCPCQINK